MCFYFKYKDFQPLTGFNTTQMDENKLFFPPYPNHSKMKSSNHTSAQNYPT